MISDFEKLTFFESAILNFFFRKKKIASSPLKLVTNYVLEWMGFNFYDYDGLQPKITPPKHFSWQCTYLKFHSQLEKEILNVIYSINNIAIPKQSAPQLKQCDAVKTCLVTQYIY